MYLQGKNYLLDNMNYINIIDKFLTSLISTSILQKETIFFLQAMIYASGSFFTVHVTPPPGSALFLFVFVPCQPLSAFARH